MPTSDPVSDESTRAFSAASLASRMSSPAAVRTLAIAGLGIAVVCVLLTLWSWQRADRSVREAARRWQDAETRVAQVEQQAKLAQDEVRELVGRSAVLESKLAETAGQLAQLERIYKNIAQDSLDAVLADVENAVSIAAQQLLVGANVQGALVALQDAESRLKRADAASVSPLRRLIARDIDRLRAVPLTDTASLTVRIDSVASAVDSFPMLAGAAPSDRSSLDPVPPGESSSAITRLASSGLKGWNALKGELQALIRVNRVDTPDALLLAPPQQYFVRENLRLILLSARFALLSRNDVVFRSDIGRAADWLAAYYDREQRAVANAIASLRLLQTTRIAVELPSLSESLGAVRSMRSAREAGR